MSIDHINLKKYPEGYQNNDLNALQKAWGLNPNKSSIKDYIARPINPNLLARKIIKYDYKQDDELIHRGISSPHTKLNLILGAEETKQIKSDKDGEFSIVFSSKELKELSFYPGLEIFLRQEEDYYGNTLFSKTYTLMQATN